MLELSAIDLLARGEGTLDRATLTDSLNAADRAAAADDWVTAGTANLRFHTLLVAVHASPRIDELFRRLMTEMRLGFLALTDPHAFHEPYLSRNHELTDLLGAGRWDEARADLDRYLDDALRQVVAAVDADR
ncbi:hypothetical protein CIK06_22715 [Plantactinospora sp. KBS50]|nr:hypothetical protein CIK06_22715 [Plantactinospora sp. KBS50]